MLAARLTEDPGIRVLALDAGGRDSYRAVGNARRHPTHTSSPTIMIAERAVDLIRKG